MKRLILWRHAKTEEAAVSGADFDRSLTERGRRDAAIIGRALSAASLIPSRVLVSAALRCVQTWEEASPYLPDAEVEVRRDLYNAEPEQVRAAAAAVDARVVLVIGHNPTLHELASFLCAQCVLMEADTKARLAHGLPPGAAVAFEIEADRIACLGLFRPKDHGGGH